MLLGGRLPRALRRVALLAGPPLLLQASAGSSARCEGDGRALRVVQYNVRRLTGPDGQDTGPEVAASLRRLAPHVVCLNEVDVRKRPHGLQDLARELGLEHLHFFGHVGPGHYGNAVLSKFPLRGARDVHLEGGTKVEHPRGSGQSYQIRRGLTAVQFDLPESRELAIASTHWDHMTEFERRVQAQHAARELRSGSASPHLLVGDLNALRREDYSDAEWAAAEQRASSNGWVAPCDANCISHLGDCGYVDAFKFFHHQHGRRVGELPGEEKFTAPVDGAMYRIDYALISAEALKAGLRVTNAFVDTSSRGSDHFPLVLDFVWEDHNASAKL